VLSAIYTLHVAGVAMTASSPRGLDNGFTVEDRVIWYGLVTQDDAA